ncbi:MULTISPECIES: CNNM domain-containing protein [Halorussus]|uniref:CNNM domain-containing protein n=1 Tax=Halorussus TaxID=1070314 RepID=UPI0020A04902|nr:hemolysin family protein [Halorussus vallis]USZ76162.1 hemolysin family protein [Halorussus vallis]
MVELATGARLVGGAFLLLLNGYFVTIEFAMTRVRQFEEEAFRGSAGLRRAWGMTDRLEVYLSGCQFGITIASVGLGVVAEPALAHLFAPVLETIGLGSHALAALFALGTINMLHVVVGEQTPTYLGIERTRTVAKYGAPPLYYWTKLMKPFIVVADRTAKGILSLGGVEMTRSWTEAEEGGEGTDGDRPRVTGRGDVRREMGDILRRAGLDEEREEEVLAALHIDDIPVSDVMVDRPEVVPLSTTNDPEENVRVVAERPHVRFPLVGESLEEFVGVVYTPTVVGSLAALKSGERSFEEFATEPMTVAADTPVSEAIDRFQAENQELALVESEGDVVGLVTATDAFEAVLGDLEDPVDVGEADVEKP